MRHRMRPALAAVIFSPLVLALPSASLGDGPAPAPAPSPSPSLLLPESRLGFQIAPLLLLSRPDLRADVGLDARQSAEVERAIAGLYARAAVLRGRSDPAAIEARKAIDRAMQGWLESHLTDAQRSRLAQLDLQWEGDSVVVRRPMVAESLSLTPQQREVLGRAVADHRRKLLSGTLQPGDEERLAHQVFDVLSPDQRRRYLAMRGRPMQLAPTMADAGGAAARPSPLPPPR